MAVVRYLLAAIVICVAAPGPVRADPALYTGSVQLRLWGRAVPYGAMQSQPGLTNSSADLVSLAGSGPAAFTLAAGQLGLTTSLLDLSPPYTSLDYRRTSFAAANDTGSFFGFSEAGPAGYTPVSSIPASQFGVSFSGAPSRFGGVMKLLGSFDWRGELGGTCGYCPFHTVIPLSPIGGPLGGTAKATATVGGTAAPPTFVTATVWGFPWETGTVGGVANVSSTASPTTTSAMGTDLRSKGGIGTLALVTPFLVRVKSRPPGCGGCENQWFYTGSARIELRFVPEPVANALLVAGLGALAVLAHGSRRRRPDTPQP